MNRRTFFALIGAAVAGRKVPIAPLLVHRIPNRHLCFLPSSKHEDALGLRFIRSYDPSSDMTLNRLDVVFFAPALRPEFCARMLS
jgi:hypothetical protein